MRKTALAVMVVLCLTTMSGFAGDRPRVGPPPLRFEALTLQPSPKHVWVPGYWKWAGVNYAWIEGRWIKTKPNRAWAPGIWAQVGNHWVWKPGKWTKIGTGEPKAAKKKKK